MPKAEPAGPLQALHGRDARVILIQEPEVVAVERGFGLAAEQAFGALQPRQDLTVPRFRWVFASLARPWAQWRGVATGRVERRRRGDVFRQSGCCVLQHWR